MLDLFALSGGRSGQALHAGSGGPHSQVVRCYRSVTGADTEHTTLDLLEAVPRQQSCRCKCIAFSVGAPWSTEVSKQVGVSGELVCAPGWDA